MGLLDFFIGDTTPTVTSMLPDAARQEILKGRLPHLNTDSIFVKNGEYCCYIDKAVLVEDKVKKISRHGGMSAPGLFKGTRVHFGQGDTKEYIDTQYYKAILYITNKRIILQCKDRGFDKQYRYLSAVKPYSNAIELQYGAKTYTIIVPEGDIPYRVIQIIQQRRTI